MSGWEYKATEAMSDEQMNALGRRGWELVTVVQRMGSTQGYHDRIATPGGIKLYWKRLAEPNPPS